MSAEIHTAHKLLYETLTDNMKHSSNITLFKHVDTVSDIKKEEEHISSQML